MALSRTQILPAVLALIVAAGTASAIYTPKTSPCPEDQARKQQPGQPAPRDRHRAPVSDMVLTTPSTTTVFGQATEAPSSDSQCNEVSVFSQTCPEGQCTIKIENGQITALRDGQPVAANLIQRDGEQIRLMSDDGREMMVVRVSPDGAQVGGDGSGPRILRRAQVTPAAPGVIVRGQPLERRALRVAPHGAQAGDAHTLEWRGEAGDGQPNVVIRRQGGPGVQVVPGVPMAPSAPQVRTRVITPQAPGVPVPPGGRAGSPRVGGQVIIQNGDGQPQVIELGELMQRHGGPGAHAGGHGGTRAFAVPGGQGQFRFQPGPGAGGGQGGSYVFRLDNTQGNGQNPGACCDDCKQDGSCCGCGSGTASGGGHGSSGAHGGTSHSFSGTGQIVIDTGNGEPQVIELGELGGHLGQLHEHLSHLQPHIQHHIQGHLQPHMDQLHEHLLQLEEIEGFDLGSLNLDTLSDDIQLHIESALEGLDSGELELKIEAIVEDALSGLDLENLGQTIELQVQQALDQAGLTGAWNAEDGQAAYTLEVVPELLADGAWRVQGGPDDHAGHGAHAQPSAPAQNRVRVAPGVRVQSSQGSGGAAGGGQGGTWVGQVQAVEQPKVMLGITMGEAPAELLEQIGLEPGSAIRVDTVIDGLPAAEAGLKPGSIIVSIDGETPATATLLRERLMHLSPGDTLHLKVVRGGQRQAIDVQLVEYDAEALKVAMAEPGEEVHTYNFQGLSAGGDQEALEQRIREAVTAMTEGGLTTIDQDALREKIEAIVRDHMTVMNGQGHAGSVAPRRMLMAPGSHAGQGGEMVFVTPGQPMTPVPPGGALIERRADVDARLAGMEERLSKLEERLDRIAELLEQRRTPRD